MVAVAESDGGGVEGVEGIEGMEGAEVIGSPGPVEEPAERPCIIETANTAGLSDKVGGT